MDLNYHSMESLLEAAKENNCRLSALVLEQQAEQMELPKQEIYEKMRENYRVMASCIQPGSAPDMLPLPHLYRWHPASAGVFSVLPHTVQRSALFLC